MAKKEVVVTTVIEDKGSKKTIKDLRNEVKGYKNDLANLEQGTKEYESVLLKLGNSQGQINEINKDSRAITMNLTDRVSNYTTALSGISSGMQAYQSISALAGVENEKFAETLVKIQAAMSLSQSLLGMSKAIKAADIAFRAFNITLLKNPLIAIAAAIAVVVGALAIFGNSLADSKSGIDELEKSNEDFNKSLERQNDELELNIRLMQAQGASASDVNLKKREGIREEIAEREKLVDSYYEEIRALENKDKAWFSGERKRLKWLKEKYKEENEALQKSYEDQSSLNSDFLVIQTNEDYRADQERARQNRAAFEAKKKEREKQIEEELRLEREANKKKINAVSDYWKEIENINKQEADRIAQEAEIERAKLLESMSSEDAVNYIQSEINALGELRVGYQSIINDASLSYEVRTSAAKEYQELVNEEIQLQSELFDAENTVNENRLEWIARLEEAKNPEDLSLDEQLEQKKLEIQQLWENAENEALSYEARIEALEAYDKALSESGKIQELIESKKRKSLQTTLNVTKDALSTASDVLGENTAAGKVAALAAATISTYQAGSSALAMDAPGPARYVAMATAIAAGLKNVKEIFKVKVPGSSSSAGSSGSGLASIPKMPELMSPIQETHNNMTANEEEEFNKPQKVYVLESDISGTQSKVNVTESEMKF